MESREPLVNLLPFMVRHLTTNGKAASYSPRHRFAKGIEACHETSSRLSGFHRVASLHQVSNNFLHMLGAARFQFQLHAADGDG
jgi:hypothetical protein